MTEHKAIYVDGVDVSECCYFNSTDENYCEECSLEFSCAICNDRPNCYFKQLARKTQECKQDEQKLERIRDIANAIINGHHFTNDIIEHFKELVKMIVQIIDEVE